MKKHISKIAGVAMLATMALSNGAMAAGVDISGSTIDSSTQITLDLPAGVDLTNGSDTFKVTLTQDDGTAHVMTVAPTVTIDGEATTVGGASIAQGVIDVTAITGANPANGGDVVITLNVADPLLADTAYVASYSDSQENYGAVLMNQGTSNQVSVTARVVPTLTFAILAGDNDANTSIELGDLQTGSYAKDDIKLQYATNADGGVVVSMSTATGLVGSNLGLEIGQTDLGAGGNQTTGNDYYKVSIFGNAAGVTFDDVANPINNAGGANMAASVNVVPSTGGPVDTTTQDVTIGAKIAADTEADSYSDTLTFVATASF